MTDLEFNDYLAEAREQLAAKQEKLATDFGVGEYERYIVEYPSGQLSFFEGEALRVRAAIVPLATHVPDKSSLKWAWANQQLSAETRELASRTKELAAITGHSLFAQDIVSCSEDTAWDIAAIACGHLDALGVYRVPHGDIDSYVLITHIEHAG